MDKSKEVLTVAERVTLQEIADKVGVSKSLVSLALADNERVSDETRAQIVLAALNLGYDLNKRRIRKGKNELYSIVVNDTSYLNTFFYTEVMKGIENELAEQGIGIDLVLYNKNVDNDQFLLDTVDKKTQGLIIVAVCDRKRVEALRQTGLPIVVVDGNDYFGNDCDVVEANNYYSGYYAAHYFEKFGHIRLGFVGDTPISMSFKQRRDGFADGVRYFGGRLRYFETTEPYQARAETFNAAFFRRMMRRSDRPTALMCANDITALNVYKILTQMGLSVPEDVSLIGFDNIKIGEPFMEKLTTFDIPKQEMGREAVRLLRMRRKNPEKTRRVVQLAASLIRRESVAAPKERQ